MSPLDKIFRKTDGQNKEKRKPKGRIERINLIRRDSDSLADIIQKDYDTALSDLTTGSAFQPKKDRHGPYIVELYIEENKLVFHITNTKGKDLPFLVLSLRPYQRIIKDYFMIVQSYDEAVRDGKPSRIEAIDMGRRGLHNEGAELLQARLSDKITMDMNTARRLFTLICVLHMGKTHTLR